MLKESYLANVRNLPKESIKVIVTRSKGHVLSPSWKMLNLYKAGKIDWAEYVRRFRKEMDNEVCKIEMKKIYELSKKEDVYLICFEKTGHCHRYILIEMMHELFD